MSYYFYLGDFMLPVPPPRMDIRVNNKNKTINLINEGEINIIKTPGLKEISFEALLPNANYPFADYSQSLAGNAVSAFLGNAFSYRPAINFLESLQTAKNSNSPVRLIITRMTASFAMLFDTNFLVTVEDFTMRDDAKNAYDIIVPLRLKEWRDYGTKEVTVTTDENGNQVVTVNKPRQTDKSVDRAWTVTKEKSVFEAVKMASGGSLNWRSVANLNGILNPNAVQPGQVLRLE